MTLLLAPYRPARVLPWHGAAASPENLSLHQNPFCKGMPRQGAAASPENLSLYQAPFCKGMPWRGAAASPENLSLHQNPVIKDWAVAGRGGEPGEPVAVRAVGARGRRRRRAGCCGAGRERGGRWGPPAGRQRQLGPACAPPVLGIVAGSGRRAIQMWPEHRPSALDRVERGSSCLELTMQGQNLSADLRQAYGIFLRRSHCRRSKELQQWARRATHTVSSWRLRTTFRW